MRGTHCDDELCGGVRFGGRDGGEPLRFPFG